MVRLTSDYLRVFELNMIRLHDHDRCHQNFGLAVQVSFFEMLPEENGSVLVASKRFRIFGEIYISHLFQAILSTSLGTPDNACRIMPLDSCTILHTADSMNLCKILGA
jgi:hypothetical protein